LSRCPTAEALVLALSIVEADPGANAGLRLGHRRIGTEVDLFVFEAAPQSLDEDVVHAAPLAVHADGDAMGLQGAGEVVVGERAALVGVEDLGPPVSRERFLERVDTKVGAERVRQPPRSTARLTQSIITTR
jgi:hypothetical protein